MAGRWMPGLAATAATLVATLSGSAAGAQQIVTNDAALIERGACRLEAFHGERASWVKPACHVVPGLQVELGVGTFREDGGRLFEYEIQAKYLFFDAAGARPGIGVVVGAGIDPAGQALGARVSGLFAHVPVTFALAEQRLVLSGNIGLHHVRPEPDGVPDHRASTSTHADWALYGDVAVHPRAALVGELFGEGGAQPEFQLGVRATAVANRLDLVGTWGGHTNGDRGAGWVLGLSWTPPPLR
jgi:hypothetical protein